jgi:hypothetical protein
VPWWEMVVWGVVALLMLLYVLAWVVMIRDAPH